RHAAAFTVILLALGFLAGCAPAHIGTTVSASLAENQAGSTVVVGCSGQQQNRPSSFVLTCADANNALTALHWVGWADNQAFGTGTEKGQRLHTGLRERQARLLPGADHPV